LANKTELGSNRWNTKGINSPIVLVTAKSESHDLFAGAFHGADWEWRLVGYLGEDLHKTRSTFLNIVLLPTIEWIDEGIAVGVDVEDES